MAQILGATPNRGPTRPPSCGGLPTGRFAADGHPQIDGTSLVTTCCDQRSHHQRWVVLRGCPGRRLPAPGPGHEPGTGPLKGEMGRAGDHEACWGQAPEQCRSARPRVKARGRGVCSQNQARFWTAPARVARVAVSAVAAASTAPRPCWWPPRGTWPDTPPSLRRRRHRPGHACRTPAVRPVPVIPEAADGQSADRSGSLQLPLLFSRPTLRPASGRPAARQRHDGQRATGLTDSHGG